MVTEPKRLEDLVGWAVLDAVDMASVRIPESYGSGFEDARMIRFRLDGVVYVATENPSDGYRSYLGELYKTVGAPMTNVFPGVMVKAQMHEPGGVDEDGYPSHDGDDEILELVDAETGKVVLEVGTDNSDSYYPSFVAHFVPENMYVNEHLAPRMFRVDGVEEGERRQAAKDPVKRAGGCGEARLVYDKEKRTIVKVDEVATGVRMFRVEHDDPS